MLKPPPAPRAIAESYRWRLMLTDGRAIAAAIFTLLGAVFTVVGAALTVSDIAVFVGIPFMGVGITGLGLGLVGVTRRSRRARKIVTVLRWGEATDGQIMSVEENTSVRVQRRHPWVIRYQFRLSGQVFQGEVSTLKRPGLQPGQAAWVLYLPQSPEHNVLYPHP